MWISDGSDIAKKWSLAIKNEVVDPDEVLDAWLQLAVRS